MDIPLIVPGLVAVAPHHKIHLKFPQTEGAHRHVTVETGGRVKPSQAKLEPELKWKHEHKALYTLLGLNPDAEPNHRVVLHWMVANIPGDDVGKGDQICAYTGGVPPEGPERTYVFLVFRQNGQLDISGETKITENTDRALRRKFSPQDFAKRHGLGNPVAGTYVTSVADDYSREFWAKSAAAAAAAGGTQESSKL